MLTMQSFLLRYNFMSMIGAMQQVNPVISMLQVKLWAVIDSNKASVLSKTENY